MHEPIHFDEFGLLRRERKVLWGAGSMIIDFAIMIRRVKQGKSPFNPDSEQLHHTCQRLGCSSHKHLICAIAAAFLGGWIICVILALPECLMF